MYHNYDYAQIYAQFYARLVCANHTPSLLTSLHTLLNTHSILYSFPPTHRCFSSTSPFCHSWAMAGHPWLHGQVPPPQQPWPPGESMVVFWKVDKFEQWWKRCDPPLYSTPYFTCRHGYRMCVRAYLNGDGLGKETDWGRGLILVSISPSCEDHTMHCYPGPSARRLCWLSLRLRVHVDDHPYAILLHCLLITTTITQFESDWSNMFCGMH